MAKKVKRQARKVEAYKPPVQTASGGGLRSFDRDFNPDYTHVKNDLRRIGVLAGSFLAILIVLTFILR